MFQESKIYIDALKWFLNGNSLFQDSRKLNALKWFLNGNSLFQDSRKLKALKWIEKSIGFKQGKGGMWKTLLTLKKDVAEAEVEKYLKTPHEEHPKIVYFMKNGEKELIEIVGDGMVIHLNQNSLEYAILVLMCCYYVFDLVFPRKYCQTLGFFQHIVLKEDYLDTKSAGFLALLWKIEGKNKK